MVATQAGGLVSERARSGSAPKPDRFQLPAFLPPQNPKLVDAPPTGTDWRHEIKYDGYRMQLRVEGGQARWFSRNGFDWTTRLEDFEEEVEALPDGVYDGEMIVRGAGGQPDFSALRSFMGSRQRGNIAGDLTFVIFDLLADANGDLRSEPLRRRKALLSVALADIESNKFVEVTSLPGGGPELLKAACQMNLEGIVSKDLNAPYQGGETRLLTWRKSKCRPSQEVVVGGFETDGARFRSLLAGVYEDGVLRYVGSIGTGFGQGAVASLMAKLRAIETERSPYGAGSPPRKTSDIHWVRPELVAAADIAEWTGAGKLRQASFKGLREDKPACDVVRERQA